MISNTWKNYKNLSTETWNIIENVFIWKHKNVAFYVRNHCNVSVSFPARKLKIELKIAMITWDILKATYLLALLYISNETMNTAYLFEISRYQIFRSKDQTRAMLHLRGYVWLAIALKRGRTPPFYYVFWIPW